MKTNASVAVVIILVVCPMAIVPGFLLQVTKSVFVALDYKALGVDRSSGTPGSPDRFVYDTVTHGPLLGLAFSF